MSLGPRSTKVITTPFGCSAIGLKPHIEAHKRLALPMARSRDVDGASGMKRSTSGTAAPAPSSTTQAAPKTSTIELPLLQNLGRRNHTTAAPPTAASI